MPTAGIRVLVIGGKPSLPSDYVVHHLDRIHNLFGTIAQFQPDVILTYGFSPGGLSSASFELRKRWLAPDPKAPQEALVNAIEYCYSDVLWNVHQNQHKNPLISIYTPTHNTGDFLREAYQSLVDQTYPNWEWVVVDDHSSDRTWERLEALAKDDIRVRPFRSGKPLRKVGLAKHEATRLCRGEYLVEFDHDDMLTDFALAEIKAAFESDPEIGMVYSNYAGFFQSGAEHRFTGKDWDHRYKWTEYRGKKWLECDTPDIYDRFSDNFNHQFGWFLTVGPHHVRAFRAETFRKLGGYNPGLPIADDWDLFVRFFLRSKCHRVPKMLYLYRYLDNWEQTVFVRNKSIQDHLALARARYVDEAKAFNERRLAQGKKETPKEAEYLLTVVVPAIPSRMKTSLMGVMEELIRQADGKPVEVMCLLDNRARNLSEKRNDAIAKAKGKFITFVDDDDRVEPDYVDALLKTIRENPKADCVVFDVMVHGYDEEPKVCKYGTEYTGDWNAKDAYYRRPNHVMAYRTEISRRHLYRKELSAINEDFAWSATASKDIKRQVRIDKVLYHYLYNPKETTQVQGTECPPMAEKGVEGEPGARSVDTKDISFVVLEAASMDCTIRCLRSIRQYAPGAEIILVENGIACSNEARALADKRVQLEMNVGFAAGCNRGAMEASRPNVCFMNNDARFLDDTPRKLLEAITSDIVVVGPYSNAAKPPQGDVPRDNVPQESRKVDMIVGLCMMMPKSVFVSEGGFDSRFLTYEDDDFCCRVRGTGYECEIVGGAFVEHEKHATFRALNMDVYKVMRDNGETFKKKHPKIRVIAIAKNEEKAIKGFFQQFESVTTDFCLLDTGSTDKTVEVAEGMGVKVKRDEFKDFASARNTAIERFEKGADWIIMLDPDERLDGHTLVYLKELLFRTHADIIYSPLRAVHVDGSTRDWVPKPFIFRNVPGIHWVLKVHEKLVGSKAQAMVTNALIDHVIAFHEDGRRQSASQMYDRLQKEEPFFNDPKYKAEMRAKWPMLDYDQRDDGRIEKIRIGPLVSAIIPTYNRAKLLERAVSSVLKQDYANIEIVIIGDGCPALDVENWKGEPRVRAFNLPNNHGGVGGVPRNFGVIMSSGELLAYLDDDNAWEPDHVSSIYEAMRQKKATFGFSSMQVGGKDLGFTEPKHQGIDTSCLIHRKDLIRKYGWWSPEAGYSLDWDFIKRFVDGKEPWVGTGKPTLTYNAETSGQKDFLLSRLQKKPVAPS